MKIYGSLILISALFAGCSGGSSEGQYDTNPAEMNAYPGDKERGNSETNGHAVERAGGDEKMFEYQEQPATESLQPGKHPATDPKVVQAPGSPTTSDSVVTDQPVQRDRIAEQEKLTTDDKVQPTDNKEPKTKKQERKERRAKRKAEKSS